jgi:hypothetical protein
MIDRITFTHTEDAAIKATLKAPSPTVFEEYWNALAVNGGTIPFHAKYNITLACRESPDADEFRALLDEDWSLLPNEAADMLFAMAGHFGTTNDGASNGGEIVDLRALFGSVAHLPEEQREKAAERAAFHRDAMHKLGADDAIIESWRSRNPHISRLCVALPWGGYVVARVPSIGDRSHAGDVQRATASESGEAGHYAALCRFVYDCSLWSAPMSTAGMIEKYPGAGSKLGMMIRDLGGGYSATVGK